MTVPGKGEMARKGLGARTPARNSLTPSAAQRPSARESANARSSQAK